VFLQRGCGPHGIRAIQTEGAKVVRSARTASTVRVQVCAPRAPRARGLAARAHIALGVEPRGADEAYSAARAGAASAAARFDCNARHEVVECPGWRDLPAERLVAPV
jgi:hypothetical protein